MALPNNLKNLLFYSANTYLSFIINQRFYGGKHYVWCSPAFNPASLDSLNPLRNIPGTSSPHDIYINYRNTAATPDRHNPQVLQNIRGIKRGASIMLSEKKITQNQYQMILHMVKHAAPSDFRPLLYLIPAHLVESKLAEVPAKMTANPLGVEYRIFDLMDGEFEVLEFKG